MEDRDIIGLLQARDERGLEELRRKYGRSLRTAALRSVSCPEDAEEVVSDVLMQVWQAIPPAEPDDLFGFLSTLTKRTAINRYHRDSAQKRGGGERPAVLEELAECLPAQDNVAAHVEQKALTAALNRFLTALPAEMRRVMVLRYVREQSVREIAAHGQISEAKVKSMLFRGRKRLRAFLEKEDWL
jgi:RNA polymerase sigma-70 factor (ECF subfamily)